MTWKDPIVEEVRRIRDEFAAQYDYNIDAIYEAIRNAQDASGRQIVNLKPARSVPSAEEERSPGALAVAESQPDYGKGTPSEP